MPGELHSGLETDTNALPSTGNRLKTALKIIFWFCLLCFALLALIVYFVYTQYTDARERYARDQFDRDLQSMPVPLEPVDIVVEPDPFHDRSETGSSPPSSSSSSSLPSGKVAALPDASVSEEHVAARVDAGVVINEIFFHPISSWNQPEDTRQEFIEIYNAGTSPVAMEGYRFSKGVKFTFPEITIEADDYLVVAADPEVFRQLHSNVRSVIGGWDGRLSNSGEEIELEDSEGKKVDAVRYSDQGDWAQRGTPNNSNSPRSNRRGVVFNSRNFRPSRSYGSASGWDWLNPADGEGHSIELRSPAVTNQCGQNWRPSAVKGGTPGARNSQFSPDIAPVIRGVVHSPVIPTPSEAVVITAEMRDELKEEIAAEIYWRTSERRDGTFRKVDMEPEGGSFSGRIPAQGAGTIVEFFVRATDGTYSRTWPAETTMGQAANALYQVEAQAPEPQPGFALYRLIMTEGDRQKFRSMSTHMNAQVNATLIADDGAGPKVRHNCGVRYRGAGSRDHYPTPMRVNIPRDNSWHGSSRMNLNSKFSWLQFIGMKTFSDAGVRAPDVKPVEVWINGNDLIPRGRQRGGSGNSERSEARLNAVTQKGTSQYDFGYYVHAEPLGGEWAERHLPEDSGGNSYKKVRPDNDWAYRHGDVSRYMRDGWSKNSNAAAADWRDLDTFLDVMNNSSRRGDYLERVNKVAHLEQWYQWFGVNAILANGEGGLAKGIDDDYGLYRGEIDPRFQLLPHDLDTIFGNGDSSRYDPYHTLFDFAERGDEIDALEDLFDLASVRRRYLEHIRILIEGTFSEERFEPFLVNELKGWVPQRELQRIINWMNSRRLYAMSEVESALGSNLKPLPAPKSNAVAAAKVISGLRLSEVLASSSDGSPDFIELHNASDGQVDAGGILLTDNPSKPSKYAIPDGTMVAPGEYLVVSSDDAGFKLEGSGEGVFLYSIDGETELDSVVFGLQIPGASIGRTADGAHWTLNRPTPGAGNNAVNTALPGQLCINEFLVHPHLRFDTDFVEIYNRSDKPVALGGVRVTDDPFNYPERFAFPPLSFINARGFALLRAMGSDAKEGDARQLPMKFAYEYGYIHIAGSNGVRIDQLSYHCQRRDISRGRTADGGPDLQYYSNPTPASSNSGAAPASVNVAKPLLDSLRISEIMFHPEAPEGAEFLELINIGKAPINLKGVRFTRGVEFEFKDSYDLQPGACVLVVSDEEAFEAEYGVDLPVAGKFKGKLSNKGETVQLKLPKPSEGLIVSVDFDDKWYPDADGMGKSLELSDVAVSREGTTDRAAWKASEQDNGSPGRVD